MDDNEVIAVLLSGYDDDTGRFRPTVVLRDAQGHVSLRQIFPDAEEQGRLRAPGSRAPNRS